MRWNDPSLWIWSPEPTHEALVSRDDWTSAQGVNTSVTPRAPSRLRGPIRSEVSSSARRADGECTVRPAAAPGVTIAAPPVLAIPGIADAHPRDVLVPEQPVIDALDEWLSELFVPERAADTAREIVAASEQGRDRANRSKERADVCLLRAEKSIGVEVYSATQARSPPGVRSCHVAR